MAVVSRQLPLGVSRQLTCLRKALRLMRVSAIAGLCGTLGFVDCCTAQSQQQHLTNSQARQWNSATTAVSVEPGISSQLLEMVVNTSRELQAEQPFKRVRIHNPEIISAQPLEGGNRLLISARQAGITRVDLLGADESVASIEIVVMGDIRELESLLRRQFPLARLELTPIPKGIIVGGFVGNAADVDTINLISQQYFPTVINRVTVSGVHTIQLQTQIMEVSRTKLRALGIDWSLGDNTFQIQTSIPNALLGGDTVGWGTVLGETQVVAFIEALRQNNLVKVLASPTLVAEDGRVASFNVGGEIPVLVPSGLGTVAVEYKPYGTSLDYFAKVLGNGRIRLEVRPRVTEIDPTVTVELNDISVPALRSRELETGVELNAGQTLAIGGLLQMKTETVNRGLPGLSEMPYIGSLFRKVQEQQNEIELLITVTPDFTGPLDPHQVPPTLPGLNSISPTDHDLYFKGYLEVPHGDYGAGCAPNSGLIDTVPHGAGAHSGVHYQSRSNMPKPPSVSIGPNAPVLADGFGRVPPQTAVAPVSPSYR